MSMIISRKFDKLTQEPDLEATRRSPTVNVDVGSGGRWASHRDVPLDGSEGRTCFLSVLSVPQEHRRALVNSAARSNNNSARGNYNGTRGDHNRGDDDRTRDAARPVHASGTVNYRTRFCCRQGNETTSHQ